MPPRKAFPGLSLVPPPADTLAQLPYRMGSLHCNSPCTSWECLSWDRTVESDRLGIWSLPPASNGTLEDWLSVHLFFPSIATGREKTGRECYLNK